MNLICNDKLKELFRIKKSTSFIRNLDNLMIFQMKSKTENCKKIMLNVGKVIYLPSLR
ncbi:MAG: hypothetical protein ACI9LN_002837 [Saprospiraceae bacterium]|jgi:hypothetical protein